MNIWDHLTNQAHQLLTTTTDLTPAVKLVQSLHTQPPAIPAAICSHLETINKVLPELAQYAQHGDRHALLMAAVLMRNPLRKIAELADPDGYCTSDTDSRHQDTLTIFFSLIRTQAEPHILTTRYLYGQTLKRTLANRPKSGTPAAAIRLEPTSTIFERPDHGNDPSHAALLLDNAINNHIITDLEYTTLRAVYLPNGDFDYTAAAHQLGATPVAVRRRAQRAIRKLTNYHHNQTAA